MFGQEAAAVLLAEKAVEAPLAFLLGTDVEQVHHQQVARLGTLHADRPRQLVHRRQIDVAHVVSRIVVLDEAAGPVEGFKNEVAARAHPGGHWNIWMPAVVDVFVLERGLAQVNGNQCLRSFS